MKYILDTDTIIYFLKGNKYIGAKIARLEQKNLAATIINHSELFFGVYKSIRKEENFKNIRAFMKNIEILPYCEEASVIFAEQKALLGSEGKIIADLDLMIASIAIKNKSTLVTNNIRHFDRIKKLKIENWYKDDFSY